jgi:hypothetical protein
VVCTVHAQLDESPALFGTGRVEHRNTCLAHAALKTFLQMLVGRRSAGEMAAPCGTTSAPGKAYGN